MADDTTTGDGDDLTLESSGAARRGRGQRRALWAALAVVALAAGTVVVSTGGDEGGLPVLPVSLSGAPRELSADSAAGMSLAWIRYVAGDGLPTLGGEGTAHRLRPDVTTESVGLLADALGLAGDIERDGVAWRLSDGARTLEVDELSGSWWFATAGSDTPVASDGSSGWSGAGCDPEPGAMDCVVLEPVPPTTFPAVCAANSCPGTAPEECPPSASCGTTEPAPADCAVPCEQTGQAPIESCIGDCATVTGEPCTAPDCVTTLPVEECPPDTACDDPPAPEPILPEPAADLPSEDEARSIALEVARTAGVEVEGARVIVDGPWDAWYVTIDTTLEGVPVSGWSTSVAVGPEGEILHAGGLLATVDALDDYPLIDARAAVDRLNSLHGTGFGATDLPAPAPAVESSSVDTTLVDPTTTTYTGSDPMPMPQPEPPAEPAEVVLTDAERILVLLLADDGSSGAYLVPGYRLTSDDGHVAEVAAVTDESLSPTTVPETTEPPQPVEPPVTGPGTIDCEVLVEDDGSGTTQTVQLCPPTTPTTTVPGPAPQQLSPGEAPEVGVPYYVDVDLSCAGDSFVLGERDGIQLIWVLEQGDTSTWSTGHEGGTFTLDAEDHGTFVGDWEGTKQATFRTLGPAEDVFCSPQPRP